MERGDSRRRRSRKKNTKKEDEALRKENKLAVVGMDGKRHILDLYPEEVSGAGMLLPNPWVLWSHSKEDNWIDDATYKELSIIRDIPSFWRVVNNFFFLGYSLRHLYLMREGIMPTWEDVNNRSGSVCTFQMNIYGTPELFQSICLFLATETLLTGGRTNILNGVSVDPKPRCIILKLWSRSPDDFREHFHPDLVSRLEGVSTQFRKIIPER